MEYTNAQYELMQQLSEGLNVHLLSAGEWEVLAYLDSCGIVQPREDVAAGRCYLSEYGKRVLADHREALRIRDENISRQKRFDQEKLQKAIAEKTERKAQKREDRIFQVLLSLMSLVGGAILGNLDRIITWICSLFQHG